MKKHCAALFLSIGILHGSLGAADGGSMTTTGTTLGDLALSINRSSLLKPTRELGYPLWKRGNISYHPSLSYSFTYAENIASRVSRTADSAIHDVGLNNGFNLGEHMTLDYSASWVYYENADFEDNIDQSFAFAGSWAQGPWNFSVGQTYSGSKETRIETLQQNRQDSFGTSVSYGYAFGSAFNLGLEANQTLNFSDFGAISRSWQTQAWFGYNVTPFFQLGVGPGYTYTDLDPGLDNDSVTANVRASLVLTRKITTAGTMGFSRTTYSRPGVPSQNNFNYSLSVNYNPVENTQIGLNAQQSVSPSAYTSSMNHNRSVGITVSQRILGALRLTAGLSRTQNIYKIVDFAQREDTGTSFNVAIGGQITKTGSISVFHNRTKNDSDVLGFTRNIYRTGVSVTFSL